MTDQRSTTSGSNGRRLRFPGLRLLRYHFTLAWIVLKAGLAGTVVLVLWAGAWWGWIMPFIQESFGIMREGLIWFFLFATIYLLYVFGTRYRLQVARLRT